MKLREWFKVNLAAGDPSVAEIHIIDSIGSWDDDWIARNFGYDMGITAKAFVEELSKLPEGVKAIHVHINSPGGDAFAGVNIANALRQQKAKGRVVDTFVDGIAASSASIIAMAGHRVVMADNALMMVHHPWTFAIGNAAELRKSADVLDTVSSQAVSTYRWHSSLEDAELIKLMDAETWMTADEAIEHGFATEKVEGLAAAASIDPRSMAALQVKVPERFAERVKAFLKVDPPTPPAPVAAAPVEVVRACREADCLELAESLIESGATLEQVKAKVGETKTAKAAAAARAKEIRALCDKAGQAELADGYVKGAMSVEDVRAHLTIVTAKVDAERVIDPTLDVNGPHGRTPNVSTVAEIYAARAKGTFAKS